MQGILIRIEQTLECSKGILLLDGKYCCVTLELPWKDNQRSVSCIPEGMYKCAQCMSPSKGLTYEVQDVPNRSDILFHKGNAPKDTKGCILTGYSISPTAAWIGDSKKGFSDFMQSVGNTSTFTLRVTSLKKVIESA